MALQVGASRAWRCASLSPRRSDRQSDREVHVVCKPFAGRVFGLLPKGATHVEMEVAVTTCQQTDAEVTRGRHTIGPKTIPVPTSGFEGMDPLENS